MKSFISVILLLVLLILNVVCEEITDCNGIIEKIDASITEQNSFLAFLNLNTITGDNKSIKEKLVFFSDNKNNSFVLLFVHPEKNKGFAYIRNGDKIWGTGPSLTAFFSFKTSEQISPHYISLADFNKKKYSCDYNFINIEKGIFNRFKVYIMHMQAKNNDNPQRYMDLWVNSESFLVLKEDIFDREKNQIKTILYSRWQKACNTYLPSHMLFINAAEKEIKTEITISKIIVTELPEYIFTRSFIEYILK